MLNNKLLRDLVQDAFKEAFLRRYPKYLGPVVFEFNEGDGSMKIMFSLPSRNLTHIHLTLRGLDYMYQATDSLRAIYPAADAYFRGVYTPDYIYHKDVDWTKK